MSIESLKEQARRHEQKEEWRKALDLYGKAIAKLAEEDQPDIGLYNRVGDICIRLGNIEEAVEHYEQAVDLYVEAELPNNAIAVCKKVIRNLPNRHAIFLRMGQIRAEQGFISDARTNFLTYAERMQQAGELDESFRALVEFADLAPDDVGPRRAVADQMAANDRIDDAVEQLQIVYRTLVLQGHGTEAEEVEARIHDLDPDADVSAEVAPTSDEELVVTGSSLADDDAFSRFGEVDLAEHEAVEEEEEEPVEAATDDETLTPEPGALALEAEDVEEPVEEDEEEEAEPLPTFGFDEDEEGQATPLSAVELEEEEEQEAEPPTTFVFDEDEEGDEEEEAEPLPLLEVEAEDEPPSLDTVRAEVEAHPDDVSIHQRFVELAYQDGSEAALVEAYLGLAGALGRAGQEGRAKAAYQQVLQVDPSNQAAVAALGQTTSGQPRPPQEVASSEDYVDLGSMILGEEGEKTTRFVVAYEEPSGDEQADFHKMLSQFKEKVSANLDADDVRAHHDLGTAYKEMGLLDEAVAEFQQALRASANHLPTYELLGQTFLELGKPEAAVRSLERALEAPFEIEDERVGIYYYLARAYEDLGNKSSAVEFYDQVFSLDINFADVTERLRALR